MMKHDEPAAEPATKEGSPDRGREHERENENENENEGEYLAMGRVAAGAAYAIDAPLARVLISLRMIIESCVPADDTEQASLLQRALEAAGQIDETVRGLRAFTSIDDDAHGVDVHQAIEIAVHLAMHEIAPRASLVRRYAPVPRAQGSLGRLTQILTSVLRNSAQSIPRSLPQANTVAIETGLDVDGHVTIDVIDACLSQRLDLLPLCA
jgi:signal transduction histidine kinase